MARTLSDALAKLAALRLVDGRRLNLLPERTHLRRLLKHLEVDCVFDVGANTGQYATALRRNVGFKGRIISFEPIPEAAAEVRRKAGQDGLWSIEQVALADVAAQRRFHVMAAQEFSSLSAPRRDDVSLFDGLNQTERTIMVDVRTLAQEFERLRTLYGFKRPFLKMDTQGFDLAVLKGADGVLSQFVGFQSELSIRRIYEEAVDFREALTAYEAMGFDLSALVPNNGGHFPALIEIDCIMVRRDLMSPALRATAPAAVSASRPDALVQA